MEELSVIWESVIAYLFLMGELCAIGEPVIPYMFLME
jgi:hypothetical protein